MMDVENKNIIIGILAAILVILIILCAVTFLTPNKQDTIRIDDLNIEKDQWGIYKIVGHITPLKDYDYLEARITLYDAQGTIVGECPLAWNSNNLKANQKISVGTNLGATASETPSYGVISFYDTAGGKDPIINFTVTFNGNNTVNATPEETSTTNGEQTYSYHGSGSYHVGDVIDDHDNIMQLQSNGEWVKIGETTGSEQHGYSNGYNQAVNDMSDSYDSSGNSRSNVQTTADSGSSSRGSSSSSSYVSDSIA